MSVAELAIFYMLHCSRNFKLVQEKMLEDYYWAKLRTPKVELDGKTLGLIGVGNIGSRVAIKALHGFNMKVIAYDPYKTQQQIPEGVELTNDFDRIFKESDFVSSALSDDGGNHRFCRRETVFHDEAHRLFH